MVLEVMGEMFHMNNIVIEYYDIINGHKVFRVFGAVSRVVIGLVKFLPQNNAYVYDTDASDTNLNKYELLELVDFIDQISNGDVLSELDAEGSK